MNSRAFFSILVTVWLGFGGICMGYDDEIMSPVKALEIATLTKNLTLRNSLNIYADAATMFGKAGAVKPALSDMGSHQDVNLAWMENPGADRKGFMITIHKGKSIFESIQQIAKRRNEVLVNRRNYIIIRPFGAMSIRSTYQQNKKNKGDLDRQVDALITTPINLIQPAGDAMEDFINAKLKESGTLFYGGKKAVPFTFKMDEDAKLAIGKINVIGTWSYQELLDAICALTGLHWRIEGNTLWLE